MISAVKAFFDSHETVKHAGDANSQAPRIARNAACC